MRKAAALLVVSGPLVQTLNIHGGSGMDSPGPWSNGVIGRALRFILLNIGGAKPVGNDRATWGSPANFSDCIAKKRGGHAMAQPAFRMRLCWRRELRTDRSAPWSRWRTNGRT